MQEMKKTLLFVAMTVLILNATGCGNCRNLFVRTERWQPRWLGRCSRTPHPAVSQAVASRRAILAARVVNPCR